MITVTAQQKRQNIPFKTADIARVEFSAIAYYDAETGLHRECEYGDLDMDGQWPIVHLERETARWLQQLPSTKMSEFEPGKILTLTSGKCNICFINSEGETVGVIDLLPIEI